MRATPANWRVGSARALVPSFGVALWASFVPAQTPLLRLSGQHGGEQLGRAVAGVGDVDGDGHADVAAGAPQRSVRAAWAGGVLVFAGRSGRVLHAFEGASAGDQLGASLAGIGDVNADGLADIAAGAPYADASGTDSGAVRVFSGKDGAVLFTLSGQAPGDSLGAALAACGDVDGDGTPDLLAGAPYADYGGRDAGSAYVVSGRGAILRRLDGTQALDLFGWAVAGCGDVDRDGRPDFLASAPEPFTGPGSVRVVSGRSGGLLRTLRGTGGQREFGAAVANAGDTDQDGVADFVVGAFGVDARLQHHGEVLVFSGADGRLLWSVAGERPFAFFGQAVAGVGDVNGDGHADVLGGTRSVGYALVASGRDGSPLFRLAETTDGDYGWAVAAAGDVDRDGVPDVLVGAWRASGAAALSGAAFVHAGRLLPLASDRHELSLRTGGTQALALEAGAGHAGRLYFLLGSASGTRPGLAFGPVHLPLNADGWLLHTLASPNQGLLVRTFAALDTQGRASAALALPAGLPAALAGLVLDHAYLVLDPATFAVQAASNSVPLLLAR